VSPSALAGVTAVYGAGIRAIVIRDAVDVASIDSLGAAAVQHEWFAEGRDRPVAVTASRLVRSKGVDTIVRAVAAQASISGLRLVVLGDGPERTNLESLARELDIRDSVLFQGFVDNPYTYLTHSDVFLFGSAREGLGSVLLEAMTCRLPIVTTQFAGALPDLIESGVTCMSVEIGDWEGMSTRITAILQNQRMRESLACRGRALVEDEYGLAVFVERYQRFLLMLSASSLGRHAEFATTSGG
jgi:glycosyltransferase involved in cell wall biosynthesis